MKRRSKQSNKTVRATVFDGDGNLREERAIPVVIEAAPRKLKNVYGTRLIVPADRTPSGRRYDFALGQTLEVDDADIDYLLTLKRELSAGCCGATETDIPYFTEV